MVSLSATSLTVEEAIKTFIFTPMRQPELLPTVLPLVLGAVVIELYFGKYTQEELGWNTSVGNAVIWATTGVTLLMTTEMTQNERFAAYGLIAVGGFIGYMDFYHKWSDTVAFVVSSSGIVYTLAYISVIMIKTSMPVNQTTVKAAAVFLVGVNVVFKVVQSLETSRDQTGVDFNR
jgi:hypothetical protein